MMNSGASTEANSEVERKSLDGKQLEAMLSLEGYFYFSIRQP